MPAFCRHNRLLENCSICSKKPRVESPRGGGEAAAPKRERRTPGAPRRAPRRSVSSGMTVRRMARAVDDGYEHDLLPGLSASSDASRLATELVWSQARLEQLASDPPGPYARVRGGGEEGAWLLMQLTVAGPAAGDEPFAAIEPLLTSWESGEDPELNADALGPRSVEPARAASVLAAYRAWAGRHEGQVAGLMAGGGAPQARFDRAFERLSMAGFGRAQRVELLTAGERLGLFEGIDPWTLRFADGAATEPVLIAAKRIFGIGDPLLLGRRLRALCDAVGVPVAAADLALYNWAAPEADGRYLMGAAPAQPDGERLERACAALGVEAPPSA